MKWYFWRKDKMEGDKKNEEDPQCRGAVRATRSVLAYSSDPESKRPLLSDTSDGLKKRRGSSSLGQMGTAGVDHPPSSDMVMRLGPGQRLSHSLPLIRETFYSITLQIVIPFFISGLGMVLAGFYLEMVLKWEVFQEVQGIIILVPVLLGLKGNLEMTLASRLSTEANLGNMEDKDERFNMIAGNLVLVQCQAIVVGLLSSILTVFVVFTTEYYFSLKEAILLCACSTLTASAASFILGVITALVIIVSKKMHANPDNIATPIAASLGDITSLAIFSFIAKYFHETSELTQIVTTAAFLAAVPLCFYKSHNNKYTKAVLYSGWKPILLAMFISMLGGKVLDMVMADHKEVAAFQPVINGVGGNLVSIQASRLSTALHQQAEIGTLPEDLKIIITPIQAFFSDTTHALTCRVLMLLMLIGHITFAYVIGFFQFNFCAISFQFLATYLVAAAIQVAILLYIAYIMTHWFWTLKINPDNSTIPYLTAIGDLLGIILLGVTFKFLHAINQSITY